MPVAHFHIPSGLSDVARRRTLLIKASAAYARVLASPIERVRVFIVEYDPTSMAVGGRVVADVENTETCFAAPYFTAIVLAGRPAAQRQELLAAFTDLTVDVLGVERSEVRGRIIEVEAENWVIGGTPASTVRAGEVQQRASAR